jgi:hypothetical protein
MDMCIRVRGRKRKKERKKGGIGCWQCCTWVSEEKGEIMG